LRERPNSNFRITTNGKKFYIRRRLKAFPIQ
jgi:hypothetical protein